MVPLVLVHGYMGGSAQWRSQLNAFGGAERVIAIDLPGFGAQYARPAPDTIAGFARNVFDELDRRGVTRCRLIGHSMGGMIVQEMLAMAPDRVERLVLYGTAAVGRLPGRFETFDESRQRIRDDGVHETARRISATWFLARQHAARYGECAALAERSSLQALQAGLDAMERWDRADALASITCPALVLWGEFDRSYTWPVVEQLWRSIPGASLAVVPGCAHAVHMEREPLFDRLVADFMSLA